MIKPQLPSNMVHFFDESTNKTYYYPNGSEPLNPHRICSESEYQGMLFDCQQIECHECARNLENEKIFKRNLNKLI